MNRVAVLTGASAGIGRAAARMLVAQGWHVIGVGRNPPRTAEAEAEIAAAAGNGGRVTFVRGDFDSMADVRRVAAEIAALTPRIHVLINNAGGVRDLRYETVDGLEAMFAANHLATFVLTDALLPILRATAADSPAGTVRVIMVGSDGHKACKAINWSDMQYREGFTTGAAYCQSKLANLLYTRALARRVAGDGIVAQAMHPGRVASNFASHGDATMKSYFATAETDAPDKPAETLVWLATEAEGGRDPGRYFFDKAEEIPEPQGRDDAAAERLWDESERILAAI